MRPRVPFGYTHDDSGEGHEQPDRALPQLTSGTDSATDPHANWDAGGQFNMTWGTGPAASAYQTQQRNSAQDLAYAWAMMQAHRTTGPPLSNYTPSYSHWPIAPSPLGPAPAPAPPVLPPHQHASYDWHATPTSAAPGLGHTLAGLDHTSNRIDSVRDWLGTVEAPAYAPPDASSPLFNDTSASTFGGPPFGQQDPTFEAALLSLSVEPPIPVQPQVPQNQFHDPNMLQFLSDLGVGPASGDANTAAKLEDPQYTYQLPHDHSGFRHDNAVPPLRPPTQQQQDGIWPPVQPRSKPPTPASSTPSTAADRSPHSARTLEDLTPEAARLLAFAAAKRSNMVSSSPATSTTSLPSVSQPTASTSSPSAPAASQKTTNAPKVIRHSSQMSTIVGRGGRGGGSKKAIMEINPAECMSCGQGLARLNLRGGVESLVPRCRLSCLGCAPLDADEPDEDLPETTTSRGLKPPLAAPSSSATAKPPLGQQRPSTPQAAAFEAKTYFDTFSAAVDMLEGITLDDGDTSVLDVLPDTLPQTVKQDCVICDVCTRVIGTGTVTGVTPDGPAKFTVEVVCLRCDSLYKPCSDCGGGGGRLTPGRWRSRELFPPGRKTCILPHVRSPPLEQLSYEVHRNSHISPSVLPRFEARCRELFVQTRLGALCRPEHLSRGDGLARTFAQAERTTVDAWNLVAPMLHEDVEGTKEMRRFLTLQFVSPVAKKSVKAEDGTNASPTTNAPEVVRDHSISNINAFAIVEHDLNTGVLFFAAFAPYATTGNQYDAHYLLGEATLRKIKGELARTNSERHLAGLQPYPSVNATFLLSVFRDESRMTQAISRRGYMTLDEYLQRYPQADPTAFPPARQTHFPSQFVDCLRTWVKPVRSEDDYHGDPPPNVLRRRKVERTASETLERVRRKNFEGGGAGGGGGGGGGGPKS